MVRAQQYPHGPPPPSKLKLLHMVARINDASPLQYRWTETYIKLRKYCITVLRAGRFLLAASIIRSKRTRSTRLMSPTEQEERQQKIDWSTILSKSCLLQYSTVRYSTVQYSTVLGLYFKSHYSKLVYQTIIALLNK